MRSSEKGTFSLSMIFSTGAGLLFSLLFYNLVHYIGASAAVREAARATARCITPSDPECVQTALTGGTGTELEWFGYAGTSADQNVDVSLAEFEYTASMLRSGWSLEYDTYEIQRPVQALSLDVYQIPIQNYLVNLQPQLEETTVDAVYETTREFRPAFPFPSFTQDESLSPSDWLSTRPGFFPVVQLGSNVRIEAGDVAAFSSGVIPVEALQVEDGDTCVSSGANPVPCDNASLAGGLANTESWASTAYVALKLFSQIQSEGGGSQVRWGDGQGGGGLFVQVFDPSGAPLTRHCLGARAYSGGLGSNKSGYNLWLRGPQGSNGGTEAVCNGDNDHSNIAVPRGGSFQVLALLKVHSSSAAVRADVSFAYFYDRYTAAPIATKVCDSKTHRLSEEDAPCPSIMECRNDDNDSIVLSEPWRESPRSCEKRSRVIPLNCDAPSDESDVIEVSAAVCDTDWIPSLSSFSTETLQGRTACSIKSMPSSKIASVLSVPKQCRAAQRDSEHYLCDDAPVSGEKPSLSRCSEAQTRITELQTEVDEINAKQAKGAPRFGRGASVEFDTTLSTRSEAAWLPLGPDGSLLAIDGQRVIKNVSLIPLESLTGDYLRKNENRSAPPISDIPSLVLRNSPLGADSVGWPEYAGSIEAHTRLVQREVLKPITDVYPFIEGVPEIYFGQHDASRGWDFNRDCTREAACSGSYAAHSSLEEMLRSFAAQKIPEAADKQYVFRYGASAKGIRHFGILSKAQAASLPLPSCAPTRTICNLAPGQDSRLVALGIQEEEPVSCKEGAHYGCFSRAISSDISTLTSINEIDLLLAKAKGLSEIQDILPYASLEESCTEDAAGCTEVIIDFSDDERLAQVRVRYQLPLSFPLSTILGRTTVLIEYGTEEIIERSPIAPLDS